MVMFPFLSSVPSAATFKAASTIADALDSVPTADMDFSEFTAMKDALDVKSTAMMAVTGVIDAFKVFVPFAPAFSKCTCDECEFGWDNG
jgi:hypothetical protein